jgi:hypothetical protein
MISRADASGSNLNISLQPSAVVDPAAVIPPTVSIPIVERETGGDAAR